MAQHYRAHRSWRSSITWRGQNNSATQETPDSATWTEETPDASTWDHEIPRG